MNARRRMTRAEQQAVTRQRLLDAASEIFATHGFEGASIDAITEHAGYTRGAFYSNFTSKAELLVALSQQRMRAFSDDVLPDLASGDRDEQVARVADWLLGQQPPVELLLLLELSRVRDEVPEAAEVIEQFVSGVLGFIDEAVLATTETTVTEQTRRRVCQAGLAAIIGVQLLRQLDVDIDTGTIELLLAGAAAGLLERDA